MFNAKSSILVVLLSLVLTTLANAQGSKGRVYVWDFVDNKGQQTDLTHRLTSEFEVALNQANCYQVLERRQFDQILQHIKNERAIADLNDLSKSSQGELRKITNAQIVVFGKVDDDFASGEYKIIVTFQNFDSSKEVKSIRMKRGRIQDSESRENAMQELVKEICSGPFGSVKPNPSSPISGETQPKKKGGCDNLSFDIYTGQINGIAATASPIEVKRYFPCFTGESPEGPDEVNYGGGVFFINHDFYFYTYRDYIEVRADFNGTVSHNLIGEATKKVTEVLGRPTYTDSGQISRYFYRMNYGCLLIRTTDGKVDEVRAYYRPCKQVAEFFPVKGRID
jgi:hypothetical protein